MAMVLQQASAVLDVLLAGQVIVRVVLAAEYSG
jgi:hypothetical protein